MLEDVKFLIGSQHNYNNLDSPVEGSVYFCQDSNYIYLNGLSYGSVACTPEQFGAVGDGITDDSKSIQSAVNSGKIVIFGQKTYAVHGIKIPSSCVLIGNKSVLLYNNTTQINNSEDCYILYNRDPSNNQVHVQGITFDGNKLNVANPETYTIIQGTTVVLSNYNYVNFVNCVFQNSVMDGLFLTTCKNINIDGCQFLHNGARKPGSSGTYNALTVYTSTESVTIQDSKFYDTCDEAIRLDDFGSMNIRGCSFVEIGQYVLEILLTNSLHSKLNFTDNIVDGTGGMCIGARPYSNTEFDIMISNNVFKRIGEFVDYHPLNGVQNVGLLEVNNQSDSNKGYIQIHSNDISIGNIQLKNIFFCIKCFKVSICHNVINVTNNAGNTAVAYLAGSNYIDFLSNTVNYSYSEGYSGTRSCIINLFNADSNLTCNANDNIVSNVAHVVKMPTAESSVGVIKSLNLSGNVANDADTLINMQNKSSKISFISLSNNICPILAEFYQQGVVSLVTIGNDCSQTIKIGRSIVDKIYEIGNTNSDPVS